MPAFCQGQICACFYGGRGGKGGFLYTPYPTPPASRLLRLQPLRARLRAAPGVGGRTGRRAGAAAGAESPFPPREEPRRLPRGRGSGLGAHQARRRSPGGAAGAQVDQDAPAEGVSLKAALSVVLNLAPSPLRRSKGASIPHRIRSSPGSNPVLPCPDRPAVQLSALPPSFPRRPPSPNSVGIMAALTKVAFASTVLAALWGRCRGWGVSLA